MRRVRDIKAAGEWDAGCACDWVVLDSFERYRRRVTLTGERGVSFLLDLARARVLRDGDGLVLDDGSIVRVVSRAETLAEINAQAPVELLRLAWHLGNRHTDVEIAGARLRFRRDQVLEDMVRGLGAAVRIVEAPFEPEAGGHGGSGPDHPAASEPHGHGHGGDAHQRFRR